jgi:ParB family chromosome partitioning protein
MSLYSNSIFFIDTEKINPNPYQPRKEFDDATLRDLSDSIRQYGVLQPLVVSRIEVEKQDGSGLETTYELIAGERRLRASRLAGVKQVPVIIREGDDSKMKLELAIIENLQREDLNPVDRARAFMRLIDEFSLTHAQVGQKMGKSREYVSNSLRILQMPQEILDALQGGRIMEGHTRPLMMLVDRPEEQETLFKEIVYKKLSVREAERIARRIAVDRVRKKELLPDANTLSIEDELEEKLGTRVHIQRKADGGKITIDFFSDADLAEILELLKSKEINRTNGEDGSNMTMLERFEKQRIINPPENLFVQPDLATDLKTNQELEPNNAPVFDNPVTDQDNVFDIPVNDNANLVYSSFDSNPVTNPVFETPIENIVLNQENHESIEMYQNQDDKKQAPDADPNDQDLYNISNFSL